MKEGRPEEQCHEHEVSSASRAIGLQTCNNLQSRQVERERERERDQPLPFEAKIEQHPWLMGSNNTRRQDK